MSGARWQQESHLDAIRARLRRTELLVMYFAGGCALTTNDRVLWDGLARRSHQATRLLDCSHGAGRDRHEVIAVRASYPFHSLPSMRGVPESEPWSRRLRCMSTIAPSRRGKRANQWRVRGADRRSARAFRGNESLGRDVSLCKAA